VPFAEDCDIIVMGLLCSVHAAVVRSTTDSIAGGEPPARRPLEATATTHGSLGTPWLITVQLSKWPARGSAHKSDYTNPTSQDWRPQCEPGSSRATTDGSLSTPWLMAAQLSEWPARGSAHNVILHPLNNPAPGGPRVSLGAVQPAPTAVWARHGS
jgi:hypothetical protein